MYKYQVFKIEITMGNDAMQSHEDVAEALIRYAARLRRTPQVDFPPTHIFDVNGNSVGYAKYVTRRER